MDQFTRLSTSGNTKYDYRFTSMLGVQMFGFILCLHVAYGLGSIFTPLFDQERSDLYNSDSHV